MRHPLPRSLAHCGLAAVALALTAGGLPASAVPPPLTAPIGGGTPGPVRQLFLDPVLGDARAVDSASLSARLETANNWSVPTVLSRDGRVVTAQLDAQADALLLSARVPWSAFGGAAGGWRARVASTVGWRLTAFWGGFEDDGIEGWHGLIGAYNFRRNLHPRNQVNLSLAEGDTKAFDLRSSRVSPGDLVVGTQVLLASGGLTRIDGGAAGDPSWGISARLDLKLPAGSLARAGGSGGVDAGLALLGTAELTPWTVVHGMAFATVVSPLASRVALQPRRFHFGVEGSLVLMAGGWAVILEDRFLSPLMEGGWSVIDGGNDGVFLSSAGAALLRPHNQITVGLRRGPFTLSFSEDFTLGSNPRGARTWFYDSNAPDVMLAFTVTLPLSL